MLTDVKNHLMTTLGLPEEMLGEFVDAFMDSFDGSAKELTPFADGSAAPDWLEIRRITHMIKGYSDGVGATDPRALSDKLTPAAPARAPPPRHRPPPPAPGGGAPPCRAGAQAIVDLHARYRAEA